MTAVSVNISMQNTFIDPEGNYDLLYPYVKDKKLHTIIDVGAWWGPWSLWWHNKARQVEIFEPNQKILPELKNKIKDLKNCTLYEVALGDTAGNVSMEYETHSGTNHIKDMNGNVTLKTLDSYNFNNVDIIKIDAEGYEIPVLKGARKTILENRPWIQIEGNKSGKRYGRTKLDINIFLQDIGMTRVAKKWPDQIWTFK